MKKRLLSMLLVLSMIWALVPAAYASGMGRIGQTSTVSANGSAHTAVIDANGTLWMWGSNANGQLGIEQNGSHLPVEILQGAVSVDTGYRKTAIIKEDGSLWVWGTGYLDDGNYGKFNTPVKIMEDVAAVSCDEAVMVIKEDYSLWMWDGDIFGVSGSGPEADNTSPTKIMDGVIAVSTSGNTAAVIKSDHTLWLWGRNSNGQIDDSKIRVHLPVKVMDNVVSVNCSASNVAAIKEDGSLWVWGKNDAGQIGDGTVLSSSSVVAPVKVMDDVSSVSCGNNYMAAIKKDSSLWMWGDNSEGTLGNGGIANDYCSWGENRPCQTVPVKVMEDVVSVCCGNSHTVAVKKDSTIWTWGCNSVNSSGALGDGTLTNSNIPIQIYLTGKQPDVDTPTIEPYAQIESLSPPNGYIGHIPTIFDITFNANIMPNPDHQNAAYVDIGEKSNFAIYRLSDDQLVYLPTIYHNFVFGGASSVRNILRVNISNAESLFEPNTEYYVTMSEGIVHFANGSTNPEIKKGDWVFSTDSSQMGGANPTYLLEYQLNGGTGNFASVALYAVGTTITIPTPVRTGYSFQGWSDGTKTYQAGDTFNMPGQDVVLTAQWKSEISYSVDDALAYASKHWDDGVGLCAEFVSRCVQASGLDIKVMTRTGDCFRAISQASKLEPQELTVRVDAKSGHHWIYQQDNLDRLAPGDVVFQWCETHQISPHIMICGGFNSNGVATFYGHNGASNNQVWCCGYEHYKDYDSPPYQHTKECEMTAKVIHLSALDDGYSANTLKSATFGTHCPVEMQVTIAGEVLDSRTIVGDGSEHNEYTNSVMTATGSGQDRSVTVTIPGQYILESQTQIEFFGTDNGEMTLDVVYIYSDLTESTSSLTNIPLTATATGYLDAMQPQLLTRLIWQDASESEETTWVVYSGETITAPTPERISDEEKVDGWEQDEDIETSNSPSESEETYYIAIPQFSNGEVIANTRYAEQGDRVTLSVYPDTGYALEEITVTNVRGRDVTLRDLGDGKYSFTMPDTRVTVNAVFTEIADAGIAALEEEIFTGLGTPGISGIVLNPAPMPFTDVQANNWFYSGVEYMWKHYLMSGVSDTQFAPNATTSRAMVWTVLARMNNVRTDLNPGGTWYENGMLWAMGQGVTDGTNPLADITREQFATMLWRNAGRPGGSGDLSGFSDSGSVSDYALSAVRWAVSNGILNGSNGKLEPQGSATRGQIAAMVMRYGERV